MMKPQNQWPQAIILISGAILILIGIIAVCLQSYHEVMAGPVTQTNDLSVWLNTRLKVTTRFPGIEMIVIGSFLEIVGYLGARPWRGREHSK
jgi:hypothetical protein